MFGCLRNSSSSNNRNHNISNNNYINTNNNQINENTIKITESASCRNNHNHNNSKNTTTTVIITAETTIIKTATNVRKIETITLSTCLLFWIQLFSTLSEANITKTCVYKKLSNCWNTKTINSIIWIRNSNKCEKNLTTTLSTCLLFWVHYSARYLRPILPKHLFTKKIVKLLKQQKQKQQLKH